MTDFDINDYVFVDCETTGLNLDYYYLLDFSYAVGLGEVKTLVSKHAFMSRIKSEANPKALEVNKWYERNDEATTKFATEADYDEFIRAIKGKTWVGSSPHFDVNFVSMVYSPENLTRNHRLFDVTLYWAGLNNLPKSLGLSGTIKDMQAKGLEFSVLPDHSSRNDVLATREIFLHCMQAYL